MIYLTGDTHNMIDGGKLFRAPYIKEGDYLIVCGDFGFIWATNPKDGEELNTLRKLERLPYTILFIDGNHENFDRLFSNEFKLVDMFGSQVRQIRSNIYHLQRGERYIIEGHSFLTIGGAMSIDKYRRTEHHSWWSQELLSKADEDKIFRTIQQNSSFDYVLSHTAPISIAEKIFGDKINFAGFALTQSCKTLCHCFLSNCCHRYPLNVGFVDITILKSSLSQNMGK
ncbi:MAG: metallophosphoesterase [Deferribacteraceae bacterium]|jgi:hypothetical protein|nr:metallophosphoesterase [Deferribacteraceae bacterium]